MACLSNKIEFVFVTSEDWNTVDTFFKKYQYNLPVYKAISVPPSKFTETNSIPASYLIDQNGHILISKTGAANWKSDKIRNLIDDLLKN